MCNYLSNFGVDYSLMIFWTVNVDSVFNRVEISLSLRLRVALSTYCPLVAQSGITSFGGFAHYQQLVFIF